MISKAEIIEKITHFYEFVKNTPNLDNYLKQDFFKDKSVVRDNLLYTLSKFNKLKNTIKKLDASPLIREKLDKMSEHIHNIAEERADKTTAITDFENIYNDLIKAINFTKLK